MVDGFCKTPRYVLKDGTQPASPIVNGENSQDEPSAIYGFSGKPTYDVFWKAQAGILTPFPLVRLYLEHQIELSGDALRLIVLDATFPQQKTLQAVTFQAVLEAFRQNSDSVPVSHQLTLVEGLYYRIEALQDCTPAASR